MKKFIALLVLCVFLVNTMGYYVVFNVNRYLIKKEMFSQIKGGVFHQDIVLLKILHSEKATQLHRIGKKEFTFYRKLYDIVLERKSGDTTLFYCLHDKKEEALLADFTGYLRHTRTSGPTSKNTPLQSLLYNLITLALIQHQALLLHAQGTAVIFPVFQTPIVPVYLVHAAPPPKSA